MKAAALVLLLVFAVQGQEPEWKLIKEMSGAFPSIPTHSVQTEISEIARNGDKVKLRMRFVLPEGMPPNLPTVTYPVGVEPSSVARVEGRIDFDCKSLKVKFVKGSTEVYQSDGRSFKSKEKLIQVADEHILSRYFCERGATPTTAPTLKPTPPKQPARGAPSLPG